MAAKRDSYEAVALSIVRVPSWDFSKRNDITHKCLATSTGKKTEAITSSDLWSYHP